jgi:phage shock protein A
MEQIQREDLAVWFDIALAKGDISLARTLLAKEATKEDLLKVHQILHAIRNLPTYRNNKAISTELAELATKYATRAEIALEL